MTQTSKIDVSTEQNIEIWKIKRLIKSLELARGNGTSMISLVIPPKDQLSKVNKMLTEEHGTATNIKSRVNRLSVLSAITSTQQRLKLYSKIPTNGLVIYCGTIVTEEGKEKRVNFDFEPHKPINRSLYLCDNRFHVECLSELLENDTTFGFIVMDGNGCLFGTVAGNTRAIVHKLQVDLPKKHGRGGQSALRFSRIRDEKRHNYVRKIAELAVQFFITNDKVSVTGLVLAGSADFKTELAQSDLFDPRLQSKLVKMVDVSYGGENGFNQAIELSADALANVKFVQEKKLIQQYFNEISQDTGKVCYGVSDTLKAMDMGAVDRLIVWENLDLTRYVLRDGDSTTDTSNSHYHTDDLNDNGTNCNGNEKVVHLTKDEERRRDAFKKSSLSNDELEVASAMPFLEWLTESYKDYGTNLEFITNRSPEGSQFVKGFGGIGGLLRFKVNFDQLYSDSEDGFYSDSE